MEATHAHAAAVTSRPRGPAVVVTAPAAAMPPAAGAASIMLAAGGCAAGIVLTGAGGAMGKSSSCSGFAGPIVICLARGVVVATATGVDCAVGAVRCVFCGAAVGS